MDLHLIDVISSSFQEICNSMSNVKVCFTAYIFHVVLVTNQGQAEKPRTVFDPSKSDSSDLFDESELI